MQSINKNPSSMTLRDIPASIFISTYGNFLKNSGQIQLPSWIEIIKSGPHKIYSPASNDWVYSRFASLVRRIYINGGQGVGKLRKIFGGKKKKEDQNPLLKKAQVEKL